MRVTIAEKIGRKDGILTTIDFWILQGPYKLPGLKTVRCKIKIF